MVNLLIGAHLRGGAKTDLRLLLAYVCLSEVGLVLLGIASLTSAGFVGAVYQQLVLGLGVAGFGLLLGPRSPSARGSSEFHGRER